MATDPRAPVPGPGSVYLLHFDQPYQGRRRNAHARRVQVVSHYIGFTQYDIEVRLDDHASGRGARLMQVIAEAGITFQLARVWQAGRAFERRLKNRKRARKLCPICNPNAARCARQP